MAQSLLTNENIAAAKAAAEKLISYPGLISQSVNTFNYAINDATISQWVSDTEVGAKTKTTILANNEALQSLGTAIQSLYQDTMSLIAASERSNGL